MRLTIRTLNYNGKTSLCLCDEHGNMLPDQRSVTFSDDACDLATFTVTFNVGTHGVVFEPHLEANTTPRKQLTPEHLLMWLNGCNHWNNPDDDEQTDMRSVRLDGEYDLKLLASVLSR